MVDYVQARAMVEYVQARGGILRAGMCTVEYYVQERAVEYYVQARAQW